MRTWIGDWTRRAALILAVAFFAGCASGTTLSPQHAARMRDAQQCDLEAESYLRKAQNANDIRVLALESCMAMRGHQVQDR